MGLLTMFLRRSAAQAAPAELALVLDSDMESYTTGVNLGATLAISPLALPDAQSWTATHDVAGNMRASDESWPATPHHAGGTLRSLWHYYASTGGWTTYLTVATSANVRRILSRSRHKPKNSVTSRYVGHILAAQTEVIANANSRIVVDVVSSANTDWWTLRIVEVVGGSAYIRASLATPTLLYGNVTELQADVSPDWRTITAAASFYYSGSGSLQGAYTLEWTAALPVNYGTRFGVAIGGQSYSYSTACSAIDRIRMWA